MAEEPGSKQRAARRLPGVVRLLIAAMFGALVAVLASYLLRKIGF